MNKKLKVFLFVVFIIAIFAMSLIVYMALISDISDKELGPTPYKIEENSFAIQDNMDFQLLINVAKEINGLEEFNNNYNLNLKEPEVTIKLLQDFLAKNEKPLEKIDLEVFKNFKLSKPILEDNDLSHFSNLLKTIQYRNTLYILKNDFENSKKELIFASKISEELSQKVTGVLSGMIILNFKISELANIKLFLNQKNFTINQKQEILNIELDILSNKFLNRVFYFEEDFIRQSLVETNSSNKNKKLMFKDMRHYPVLTAFFIQPNKSTKLLRPSFDEMLKNFEENSHKSFLKLSENKTTKRNYNEIFRGNFGGKIIVEFSTPIYNLFLRKVMSYNNYCNQIILARKIIEYKIAKGELPDNLEELKLDKRSMLDIYSGELFMYSKPNGVLQSIGKNMENFNGDLTEAELSIDKLEELKVESDISDDIIFFLK